MKLTLGKQGWLALALSISSSAWGATPFDQCPTQAFLVQDSVPRMYGVDLSTGYVRLLADNLGTSGKFNGIGFNYSDGLIYGWSYEHRTLARLGSDLIVEPISLANTLDDNYFVGDVSVDGNFYYAYKRGTGGSHGLWRIALQEDHPDHLRPIRVIDGASLNLKIYDFAFHPDNGLMYSVTNLGNLVSIDPATGTSSLIADLQEPGVYGAVYFDVDGRLYISRNTDGSIFQVIPDAAEPNALQYASGPNSGQNDGARCALAPVVSVDQSTIDFGDAPDTYGTTLAANGARHNTENSLLWMGTTVDAEAQAQVFPESDEQRDTADEDGVVFITPLAAGEAALVSVDITGEGYLNAWFDLDRDGEFSPAEQLVSERYLSEGQTVIAVDIPASASDGPSWSRFRLSSMLGTGPTGGVADGEVEDYAIQLFGRIVTSTYYPAPDSYVSLAYEDLWPQAGDYDLNDLIVFYRTVLNTVSLSNRPEDAIVDSVMIEGEIAAIGAALHNGFAVELTGVARSLIDTSRMSLTIGGQAASHLVLEEGAGYEHAVLVIYEDAWSHVSGDEGCKFFRTEDSCGGTGETSRFSLTVPVDGELPVSQIDDQLFNPFIFGTNARRREVHLKNRAPTPRADLASFGTGDDASSPGSGIYYQTESGLPWAIVIGDTWSHPEEARDLLQTYPDFGPFVTSSGSTNQDWHHAERAVSSKLYEE